MPSTNPEALLQIPFGSPLYRRDLVNFEEYGGDVASAAAITPPGKVFHVTGTTTITSVVGLGLPKGTVCTLIFDGILTFTDGNNLKIAGDLVSSSQDTITIAWDGSNWYEVCRSVN